MIIYTDGSCISNPNGPGGWAICILEDTNYFCMSGNEKNTTNNRMELKAILEALSCIKESSQATIYTDSQLCINCATGKWKRKANLDLWEDYDKLSKNKNIKFEWVKGHSGDRFNEIVDKMAYEEAKSVKILSTF